MNKTNKYGKFQSVIPVGFFIRFEFACIYGNAMRYKMFYKNMITQNVMPCKLGILPKNIVSMMESYPSHICFFGEYCKKQEL